MLDRLWPTTAGTAVLCVLQMLVANAAIAAAGLPFSSSFETGDFSEWDGGLQPSMSVVSTDATDGRFSAQAIMTRGQTTDNYKDFVFGDHPRVGGNPVTPHTGAWLRFDIKFDSGFMFGSSTDIHKIAILNFEDENGRRRYQLLVNVFTRSGEYFVEHLKWNADRTFNRSFPGFRQNVGSPVATRLGQWDRLVLFVRPNTPGSLDGEVRFWVNGSLKADYRNVNIREDAPYNPNKLIMSNYVTDTSTVGIQRWDNFYLGESDPAESTRPMPPRDLTAQ